MHNVYHSNENTPSKRNCLNPATEVERIQHRIVRMLIVKPNSNISPILIADNSHETMGLLKYKSSSISPKPLQMYWLWLYKTYHLVR